MGVSGGMSFIHIGSDINKGRIAMADGCELSVTEEDGAKIYEVVKK